MPSKPSLAVVPSSSAAEQRAALPLPGTATSLALHSHGGEGSGDPSCVRCLRALTKQALGFLFSRSIEIRVKKVQVIRCCCQQRLQLLLCVTR